AAAIITGAVPPPPQVPLPLPDRLGGGVLMLTDEQLRALQAISGSIEVESRKGLLQAAKKGMAVAEATSGPEIRLDYSRVRQGPPVGFDVPFDGDLVRVEVIPSEFERLGISARKPIWDSGRKRLAKYLAKRDRESARQGLIATSGRAALNAQESAYNVLRAQELEHVAVVSLTQLAEHLRVAEERYASGLVAYLDVITAEADLAQAQRELIAAGVQVELAKLELKKLLRIELDRDITVEPGKELKVPDMSVEDMIRRAVGDVEGVEPRADIRAAEEAAKKARAEALAPLVNNGLSLDLIAAFDRQTATGLAAGDHWQYGFAISKPLYDAGLARRQRKMLQEMYEVARLEVDRVAWEAARQVAAAYALVQAADKEVEATRRRQLSADESLRVWRLKYENGFAVGSDVLDAQAELTRANAALVDARYERQLRVVRLRTAMGDWRALIRPGAVATGGGTHR
ncbi:MAG: TolC family protein, partial [Armatimonadota bacterium]